MTTTPSKADGPPRAPNQAVLYPAFTQDYRLGLGEHGYGLFANRKMKKGKMTIDDSLEYSFSDVMEGDMLLLDRYKKASKASEIDIPQYLELTREILLTTHGVPCLYPDPTGESGGIIRWRLEVPGMMMNHSCDPNTIDFPPSAEVGEGYAARTIPKGTELTFDYCLQYYDHGPFFSKCWCGSKNCRGQMMGFKALSDEQKEKLFPAASKAVQAMHLADTGKGPPVKFEQPTFPPRDASSPDVLRLVCPPPSAALAQVEVRRKSADGKSEFSLYALRDFERGEEMYDFWNQTWPNAPSQFDMTFAASVIGSNDPTEGTVIRIEARHVALKNKRGYNLFSGWNLLMGHSCNPNVVYDHDDEDSDCGSDDEGFWGSAAAAKNIKAGDELTMDYNCLLWDRAESDKSLDSCMCGTEACTGTVRGFKHISQEAKEERKAMSWLHGPPLEDDKDDTDPGEVLSKHVRAMWRQDPELKASAPPESDSEDDSSSSSTDLQ